MSIPTDDRLAAAREALADAERAASAYAPRTTSGSAAAGDIDDGDEAGAASGARRVDEASGPASDPRHAARQVVLRQLAVGPRTRKQLADKLASRDVPDDVATDVLDRMADVGLVDDEAFAEMFVRSQQETKGLAAFALRHELQRKGIAEEVADRALRDVEPLHERAQAEELVVKRLAAMQGLDRTVQTRRLAAFLGRKGYGAGVAYEVIRAVLDEQDAHRRD